LALQNDSYNTWLDRESSWFKTWVSLKELTRIFFKKKILCWCRFFLYIIYIYINLRQRFLLIKKWIFFNHMFLERLK
jgi:hypothetical protein